MTTSFDIDVDSLAPVGMEEDLSRLEALTQALPDSLTGRLPPVVVRESDPAFGRVPAWPGDITLATPEVIGSLMGYLSGMLAYGESELARLEALALSNDLALEWHESAKFLELREEIEPVTEGKLRAAKKRTEAEVRALVALDTQTRRYRLSRFHLEAKARLLRAKLNGYRQQYAACSRELSRRGLAGQVGLG